MTVAIKLYRAMCSEEAEKTLKMGSLQFFRNKEKCFSPSLQWIVDRVLDGKFNNSSCKPNRYTRVLEFTFEEKSYLKFRIRGKEAKVLSRQVIKVLSVREIDISTFVLPTMQAEPLCQFEKCTLGIAS